MTDQSIQTISHSERRSHRLNVLLGLTLLGPLLLLWLALSFATTTFWTANNIANLLRQGAMIAILAIGETFAIITGGIDLSVGAIAGFISMTVALLLTHDLGPASSDRRRRRDLARHRRLHRPLPRFWRRADGPAPVHHDAGDDVRAARHRLSITNGATISITNDAFTGFSRASFLGFPWTDGSWFAMPVLFWMVLVVAVPLYILLTKYPRGRYLLAIGSNKEAALLSGVNVTAMIYLAYIISSFCAAFVGVLLAMRIGIGNPGQADGWELQAIASSVIGGTSLFGGVGRCTGR